jgi:TPR repeat protein
MFVNPAARIATVIVSMFAIAAIAEQSLAGSGDKKVNLYEQSCNRGDAAACTYLGLFYTTGEGVKLNYYRANELFEKACSAGYAAGCTELGFSYQFGQGVKQNYHRAAELYEKACSGGNLLGCFSLGNVGYNYEFGQGVKKNYHRAAELYEKACSGGYASACANLGHLYRNGKGVAQDRSRAAMLYRKAVKLDKSIEERLKKKGIRLEEEPKARPVPNKKKQHSRDSELPDDLGEL